jgi:hypothetical protein
VGSTKRSRTGARAFKGLTCDVRVCSCLEGSQTVTNDEDADTKPAERMVHDAGDAKQSTNTIQAKTPYEDGLVAVVTQDPGSMS